MEIIGRGPETLGLIYGVGNAAGLLTLLWAYLSDTVPLWGTRREGYVMFASLLTALGWIALAFGSSAVAAWIAAAVLFGLLESVTARLCSAHWQKSASGEHRPVVSPPLTPASCSLPRSRGRRSR